ncbi:N-acetylglucosamine kinase [Chimaeribacter arupi]|uniref:N-acetyl-D-glucosamine kinase n=1 Tax=Nissabacter archeti TaxID=1917880 RepID=A0ABS5JIW8_9GAMM|nr:MULTISPECIES: N-acetylglucosamine kinase [Yersiniaceae]MBS0969920.1 N-acetylglucosamine kinase [Nissabacter archeti]MDV5139958.1 N-acetylglucosamine kinase [Chimaeribacter arupi]PLR39965.1 N-acetylglucosamine kinase [Chimaeribacter arupi]PLR49628.1 N-acetylglucosamine kinase [Chimaeribacter arupi]PLR51298.1 N-acetylglucosamine kinase [Chimaeribacter arupi]
MYYGIDMGGSKIELAVFDRQLTRRWQKRVPTPRDDYAALLAALAALVQEADARVGGGRVGIGIPGLIKADGTLFSANVPAASGKRLQADLARLLGRDVRIDNDANCFALSEAWDDEFRAYPSVLGLILGTGVGGGLVFNGRVFGGRNGVAGEVGHMRLPVDARALLGPDAAPVVCGCGQTDCMEGYLSGRGFERLYALGGGQPLTAPAIMARYRAGDAIAVAHVDRYADLLAACLGNLLTVLDPHLVVIGGGLSNVDELYPALAARLPAHLLPGCEPPRIEKARYGDAGGARGAACLNLLE